MISPTQLLPVLAITTESIKKPSVREVLIKIPGAQVLAGIAAGIAIVFALYYAMRSGAKTEEGERRPVQVGPIAVSLLIAFGLIGGVVLNDEFAGKTIPIYSYGFMVMLGFAMAIFVSALRSEQVRIDLNVILDLGLWTMLAGIAGARIFYLIQYSDHYTGTSIFSFFEVWKGGLVFYGGLIGGAVAGISFLRYKKIKVWRIADVVAPAVPLGISFARFGCFLNGCCYGGKCDPDFPLALTVNVINKASTTPEVHYLHPAQLYSSVDAFVIFWLTVLYSRLTFRRRVHGEVFFVFIILYSVGRFSMEAIRNDTPAVFGTGMTIAQVVSVGLISLALPALVWTQVLKKKGRAVEADSEPPHLPEPAGEKTKTGGDS